MASYWLHKTQTGEKKFFFCFLLFFMVVGFSIFLLHPWLPVQKSNTVYFVKHSTQDSHCLCPTLSSGAPSQQCPERKVPRHVAQEKVCGRWQPSRRAATAWLRMKSEGDWGVGLQIKHHRFISLMPQRWKFHFGLCKENKQRQWHFHPPKQFLQINTGRKAASLWLSWVLIKDFALGGWWASHLHGEGSIEFLFQNFTARTT